MWCTLENWAEQGHFQDTWTEPGTWNHPWTGADGQALRTEGQSPHADTHLLRCLTAPRGLECSDPSPTSVCLSATPSPARNVRHAHTCNRTKIHTETAQKRRAEENFGSADRILQTSCIPGDQGRTSLGEPAWENNQVPMNDQECESVIQRGLSWSCSLTSSE